MKREKWGKEKKKSKKGTKSQDAKRTIAARKFKERGKE